jgi:hypothetical protein
MTSEEKYVLPLWFQQNQEQEQRQWNAIFTAGQLGGLSMHLDVEALEKFLEKPPADFKYGVVAKAAIQFTKTVRNQ